MENIVFGSEEYGMLSNIEKLDIIQRELNLLFNEKNVKLVGVKYHGESKTIPYTRQGLFKNLCENEKSLFKKLGYTSKMIDDGIDKKENDLKIFIQKEKQEDGCKVVINMLKGNAENDGFDTKDDEYKLAFDEFFSKTLDDKNVNLEKEYKLLNAPGVKKKKNLKNLFYKNRRHIDDNPFATEYEMDVIKEKNCLRNLFHRNKKYVDDNPFISSKEKKPFKENTKKYQGKFLKYNHINVNSSNNGIFLKTKDTKKMNGLLKAVYTKFINGINNITCFIKNRRNGKFGKANYKKFIYIKNGMFLKTINDGNKKKGFKTSFAAIGLACVMALGLFSSGANKKDNKKMSNETNNSISTGFDENIPSASQIAQDKDTSSNTETVEDKNITKEEIEVDNETHESQISEEEELYIQQQSISFEDVVTIDDNSYIYTNSYDASAETNCMTPMYNGSYERNIMGVVYNLNGNIYTIYSSDQEAYEKAEYLIEQGAKEEAVLVTRSDLVNTGQYEGYYNIDSVKIKTRIR